jgi:hypothetical protein
MEPYLNFCRNLRIEAQAVDGAEPARTVALYAREHGITQVFVTRDAPDVGKLVNMVRDMQVTIVAERVRHV